MKKLLFKAQSRKLKVQSFAIIATIAFCFLLSAFSFTPTGGCKLYQAHAPILLTNKRYVVISGDSITGAHASCIKLINCDHIRITACKLQSTDKDTAMGVKLINCTNIQVDNNYITGVAQGVYASGGKHINVTQNDMLNMNSSTAGSYVQFVNVTGGSNRITKNHCENLTGTPQDGIDVVTSSGLSFSPIYVQGNYIRGYGASKTGSGIKLAHTGGSWQLAQDNILVNCGTNGIVIDSGRNIKVINNKVFSKQVAHRSYAGIRVINAVSPVTVTITGNSVNWKDSSNTQRDTIFLGKHQVGYTANTLTAAIDSTLLPVQLLKTCNHTGF
jgi:hypothetical protein